MTDGARRFRLREPDADANVRDEIAFHVDGVADELRARGMSADAARREAIRQFGDLERTTREMRRLARQRERAMRGRELITGLRSDLRYAVGPGLRYQTPVGPIRFDFGYQLNPIPGLVVNGQPEKRHWRIHFSIGQAF